MSRKKFALKAGSSFTCTAICLTSFVNPLPTSTLHAQALQPVVDVCTGITLPRSAVTNVIGAVNQPIVSQIEATVDALKTTTIVLSPLANIPDLNIDLSSILANAAAGAPLSAQVLDKNGNIVAPGNCNLTADGYALNTPAGIAIGGNQISGLGTGTKATAGTTDSIAFGNGAMTDAAAPGSVALGTNASVTAPNSVALGTGSTATRGALTNYTAPGIAGLSNSTGTVSVGAPGALRQITNLAPGTAPTDAANVAQVQGALDATAALNANAVKYTDGTHTQVALDGAGGTRISGVAPGTLAPGSTDAVNGSQLAATNANVAGNTTAITDLQTGLANQPLKYAQDGNPAVISATPTNTTRLVGATANPVLVTNVAAGALTPTSTDAVNGSQLAATNASVAANTAQTNANTAAIATLDANAVKYDNAGKTSITLGGGAGGTRITNVTAGALTPTSTDAVNGSQLAATNANVAANTGAIVTLQTQVANSPLKFAQDGNPTVLSATPTNTTRLVGATANPVLVTNVGPGALTGTSTDAVNGSQLAATNANVAANTGAIAGLDTRTTNNTTAITQLQTQVANVPLRYVQDNNPSVASATPTNTAALVGANGNPVRTTNVANGTIAAGSTDAVNGGQLAATNAAVAANTTQGNANTAAIAALDANAVKYDNAGKSSVTLGGGAAGTKVTNVAAGIVAAGSSDAVNGSQLAATNAAVANIQTGIQLNSLSGTQYSNAATPTTGNGGTITQDVTFVGVNPAQPVRVHNVATGTLANDAVNVGQLQAGLASTLASANGYTDGKLAALSAATQAQFAQMSFDLKDLREDAMAGTAGAMAYAGVPQTLTPGKSMIGGAISHYRGQTAFAFGFSSAPGDGNAVFKIGGTMDTRGNGGVTAGAGFSF